MLLKICKNNIHMPSITRNSGLDFPLHQMPNRGFWPKACRRSALELLAAEYLSTWVEGQSRLCQNLKSKL